MYECNNIPAVTIPDYHVMAAAARREQAKAVRRAALGTTHWLRRKVYGLVAGGRAWAGRDLADCR